MNLSDGNIVKNYNRDDSFLGVFDYKGNSLSDIGNKAHKHNLNIKVSRESLFEDTNKDSIWELFTDKFLEFKDYPCNDSVEKEVKSLFGVIKIFEDWKSKTYPMNVTMIDFLKLVERHTLHAEAQDYRIKAIQKYKSTNKNTQVLTEKVSLIDRKLQTKLTKDSDYLNLGSKNSDNDVCVTLDYSNNNLIADNLLRRKREIALNKRRMLLNRRDVNSLNQ
ncbi:hypothetical protein RS030_213417 [Cryptosporidium xiaoi]|uniref:Uncharacterized protein n=1 Tax=Cryptosporidium xiaoi TaxID=659607 RepID=A0AAV9XXE9_9CRYT